MTYALVSALCLMLLLAFYALASQPDAVQQEHQRALRAEATVTAEATYLPTPRPTPRCMFGGNYYNYGC